MAAVMEQREKQPSDILRIAVGLSALKCKKPEQSLESFLIDVRNAFHCFESEAHLVEVWRVRALNLENHLRTVQQKFEDDRVKLLAMKNPVSSEDPSNDVDSRKRVKKKMRQREMSTDGLHNRENDIRNDPVDLVQPQSLASALEIVETLNIAYSTGRSVPLSLLSPVVKRALRALATFLKEEVLRINASSPLKALDILVAVLPSLCKSVFALLSLKELKALGDVSKTSAIICAMDGFLGILVDHVLTPIICSFTDVSRSLYAMLSKNWAINQKGHRSRPVDLRIGIFDLFQKTFTSLVEAKLSTPEFYASVRSINDQLASQAMNSVDGLFGCSAHDDLNSSPETSQMQFSIRTHTLGRRVARLAEKDSLWYLCNILYLVMVLPDSTLPALVSPRSLRRNILISFLNLMKRTKYDWTTDETDNSRKSDIGSDDCETNEEAWGNEFQADAVIGHSPAFEGEIIHSMMLAVVDNRWNYCL